MMAAPSMATAATVRATSCTVVVLLVGPSPGDAGGSDRSGTSGGAVMVVVTACSSPGADDVQRMLPAVMGRRHGCFDRR
jgi:hypothetical protein